ncbi:hypothetical protein BASA61_009926 [Batrachochytrium salamandrivorans]|nr:hypothetical protein BASA62_004797 [Batrachochytrium salamandrivorans]KAH6579939.1 hypothetical protein BASA61_009926 [Batrachochytrium salamandrivorans]KAJ1334514.1 hypothetical protein BSLG_007669 [Batrachochytrium salamandrivorans]
MMNTGAVATRLCRSAKQLFLGYRSNHRFNQARAIHYVVYACDFTDPGVYERRLAVRGQHIADAKRAKELGIMVLGGALLDETLTKEAALSASLSVSASAADATPRGGKMAGSMLVLDVPDMATAQAVMQSDVYWTSGVWDPSRTHVCRFWCAPHYSLAGGEEESSSNGSNGSNGSDNEK